MSEAVESLGPFDRRRYTNQLAAVYRVFREKPETKAQILRDFAAGVRGQYHGEVLAFCADIPMRNWQMVAALIRHNGLSERQRAIYQQILDHPDCSGEELEKHVGLSSRSIRRSIAVLREYGYRIKSTGRGRGGPARYAVVETSTPNA